MFLNLCVLASGSSGNCTVVWTPDEALLIDCGSVSGRFVREQLSAVGVPPARVKGMLITHAHSDHIGPTALRLARDHGIPLYLHPDIYGDCMKTAAAAGLASLREEGLVRFHADETFALGAFGVQPFRTRHRMGCVTRSQGFCVVHDGAKIGYLTDCGAIDDTIVAAMRGARVAVIEANHDVDMVASGPRPWPVKKWILSDDGHLSNDAAAALIRRISGPLLPLRHVLLAHISKDHNTCATLPGWFAPRINTDAVTLTITHHRAPSAVVRVRE